MKILLISDTHGMTERVVRVCEDHGGFDLILHLGDYQRDQEEIMLKTGIAVKGVAGNCDWGSDEPTVLTPVFRNTKIYMTHGHLHNVKVHYQRILYAALEAEARVCLFGHTHRAECFRDPRGLWVMNPGACGPRGSYGVLTIGDGEARCQLKSVK